MKPFVSNHCKPEDFASLEGIARVEQNMTAALARCTSEEDFRNVQVCASDAAGVIRCCAWAPSAQSKARDVAAALTRIARTAREHC